MDLTQHLAEEDVRLLSLLAGVESLNLELGNPLTGSTLTREKNGYCVAVWDSVSQRYEEAEGIESFREALQIALTDDLKSVREIAALRDSIGHAWES